MKIFVSYARANKEQVLDILHPLSIHDIWIDQNLNIGEVWWQEIQEQIAACHCFLFMISPTSLKSEYCQKELELARQLGKPIAPVLVEMADVPLELSQLQIIDATKPDDSPTTVRLINGLFEVERTVFNPLRTKKVSAAPQSQLKLSDLTFVTTNQRKVADYEAILDVPLQTSPIPIADIQELEVAEVAAHKVQTAYAILHKPVFVEQSGISIRAWGGLPGGLSTPFVLPLGLNNLCKMMSLFDDHYAEALSVIAFTDGTIHRTFIGRLEGEIASVPRYGEAFNNWDAIFIPKGFTETIAEMSAEKRLSISMRRRAVVQFMQFLQSNYDVQ